MPRSQRHRNTGHSWLVVVAALAVFGAFGCLQMILAALNVHLAPVLPAVPTSSHGVTLVQAPARPAPVPLTATARPVDPDQPPASMPRASSTRETALVTAEDARVRALVHDSARIEQPQVIRYPGALPTLVLPPAARGYTAADLAGYGALAMLPGHAALLQENVFAADGAQLSLGAPVLRTLYLASGSSGFASIIGWDGNLSFAGTAAQPLTIIGWNQAAKSLATDQGHGRSYIREIGGAMTVSHARVASLGFWSGRTGGVAWTGASRASSTGSAVDSVFAGDTYGAFVSRGEGVSFTGDRFQSNELDGLHIHRYSTGSRVTSSSAARNGGNGFVVDRATTNTLLRGDVSQHNAANGYLIDGRPLVSGASASGGSNAPSSGTVLEGSAATGNAHTSALVEGGTGTVVKSDQFCSPTTALALRAGVANSVVTGNYIGCASRSGISVGPSAPGTVIFGNAVSRPGIGMLIRDSGPVSLYDNRITGATVFGVSARGASSRAAGVGNVMSGTGSRPVDARTAASVSGLLATDTSGWSHQARLTFVSYLEFHPLASLWLGILVVILLAAGWSYRRKLPDHPYPASVRRYPAPATVSPVQAIQPVRPGLAPGSPPTTRLPRPAAVWAALARGGTDTRHSLAATRQQPTFDAAPPRRRPAPRVPPTQAHLTMPGGTAGGSRAPHPNPQPKQAPSSEVDHP